MSDASRPESVAMYTRRLSWNIAVAVVAECSEVSARQARVGPRGSYVSYFILFYLFAIHLPFLVGLDTCLLTSCRVNSGDIGMIGRDYEMGS